MRGIEIIVKYRFLNFLSIRFEEETYATKQELIMCLILFRNFISMIEYYSSTGKVECNKSLLIISMKFIANVSSYKNVKENCITHTRCN
jgi:hypothetical protein